MRKIWFAAALFAANPASATLTVIDDPVYGPQSLVWDTTSGLEWLRLDHTQHETVIAGFRVASAGDWAGLMAQEGFPTMPGVISGCWAAFQCEIDPAAEMSFTALFEIPIWDQIGYDYNLSPGGAPIFDSAWFRPDGVMMYNGLGEGCLGERCDLALVRPDPPPAGAVPEPSSIWMLLAGLLAFPAMRRRCPKPM